MNLTRFVLWLRGRVATLITWAVGAGLALTAFELYQNSIDATRSTLSYGAYRWFGPSAIAFTILLSTRLLRELVTSSVSEETNEVRAFAKAILAHARRLFADHRHTALLRLRADESLRLHVLGRHEERREIGALALKSAAALERDIDKAAVLIDDLGWANYLIGNTAAALKNINKGTSIANTLRGNSHEGERRHQASSILAARGIRHSIVINAAEQDGPLDDWLAGFDTAESLLNLEAWKHDDEIRQELGQLHHSRAFAMAVFLGVNRVGTISPTDQEGRRRAAAALESLARAEGMFRSLDDDSRLPKVYLLRTRLLEALGDEIEAASAMVLADEALRKSAWAEPDGIQSILGPPKKG